MSITIRFRVFCSDQAKKPLLECMVTENDNLSVDFNSLFKSFRYLFGKNCVIVVEYY